ncbi:hypothetical protein BGZ63DRAFT_347800 [Mariannaea sp. PMI_226]|nr:hypothetical protein BGZ63DRAFT_347800 [Mariannaea sp. PMI_226]
MPLRRPSTSDGLLAAATSSAPASSSVFGTRRRFPLLGRSKKHRNSELIRPSTGLLPTSLSSSSPSLLKKPGLRIHVHIKFEAPLNKEYTREYEASPTLVATDRLCQGLLSRLQHCTTELISRHDCSALDPLRKPHRDAKPMRYRITYRVERDGVTLFEKCLRSFQEYAPTPDDASEVLSATDRIVGLFLVRHDSGFRWPTQSEPEPTSLDSEKVRPYTGRPQPTCCIPRSRYVPTTQSFELVPGYTIELYLRSRCATRYPENRNATIKIDSRQATPLTVLLGEELITRASNLIIDPIDSWKRKFDKRHRSCTGFEGSGGCTHVEDGAVDVMVKVRNNLGPDYNYFSHRIQTSKVLFSDPNGRDFDEFVNGVKGKLEKARDMSDKSIRSLDDLTLRVRELRGQNWSVHEPLTVRLDSSVTYCRQTVEAMMERLQSGISNVLESHEDALATLTVHKRGHLIFDGFLDGAGGDGSVPYEKFPSPEIERKALESKLKDRIRADITILCKDTCSLDCTDYLSNLKMRASGASAGPRDNTRPENMMRPENHTRSASQRSIADSIGSGSVRSDLDPAKKQPQRNPRELPLPPSTPVSLPPTNLQRVPSGVEMAKKYGYMTDLIANEEEEHQSEPPSTPSLVDTDSLSPRDSVLVTPQSSRAMSQSQSTEGLRVLDDGRRVIYEEQDDIAAIARGVTEFHPYVEDELVQLGKDYQLGETPSMKPTPRSLDTMMPNLSGKLDSLESTEFGASEDNSQKVAAVAAPTPVTDMKSEGSREEWEMIEANEATNNTLTHTLSSEKAETNSKLETCTSGSTCPPSVQEEVTSEERSDKEEGEQQAVEGAKEEEDPKASSQVLPLSHDVDTESIKTQESHIEVPTREPLSNTAVEEPLEALRPETVRSSSDSGISMHEHFKEEAAKEKPIEAEETKTVDKEVPPQEETPRVVEPKEEKVEVQCLEKEPEPEPLAVSPKLVEPLSTVPPGVSGTTREQIEEVDYQTVPVFSLASSPTLEPRPALTTSASTPLIQKLLTPEERCHMGSHFEEHPEPPRFEQSDLPRLRSRPRTNTLPERRYSTALTLEIDTEVAGPEWASQNVSPVGSPIGKTLGVSHAGFRHRRQPSAGLLGLREQRIHEVGLRNAIIPYRWRTLRSEQELGNRPSTAHSEH